MKVLKFVACSAPALLIAVAPAATPILKAQQRTGADRCVIAAFQASAPSQTTITSARHLDVPAPHCRVEGYVTTTNPGPNRNNFALQLPDKWNTRFYFVGVGGSGGSVPYASQIPAGNPIVSGFAVAGTDKGHQSAALDWSWSDDPAKALDNAHRGSHVVTVAAQQMTRAYYGAQKMFRYHSGCSGGGAMGMMAMQKYPRDYDGVLLGWPGGRPPDPAKRGQIDHAIYVEELNREPGAWLSPAKLQFVGGKVLQACDVADGAKDDMIWNSRLCHFDFISLACKGETGDQCLTRPEITTFQNILRRTSAPISTIANWTYFGEVPPPWSPDPSRENSKAASSYILVNGWARTELNQPDRDILKTPLTRAEMWRILTARAAKSGSDPYGVADLSAFAAVGGKSIFYVGEGDTGSSNLANEQYIRDLEAKMGKAKTASMTRLYNVPGWGHCGGSAGPSDASDRLFQALIDWVEKGVPPTAVSTHGGTGGQRLWADYATSEIGVRIPPPSGPDRDFLLCPFPQEALFDQSKLGTPGAVLNAINWHCGVRKP